MWKKLELSDQTEKAFCLLRAAHLRAIKRLGLRAGNIGWVTTDDAFLSKTSGGILQTVRLGHRRYEHTIV
jgi:hypothetical protein